MPFFGALVSRQAFSVSGVYTRNLSITSRCLGGGSTRHDNNPEVLEKGKQSVLNKHKKGSMEPPRWHEELASDAEAFVKSQRNEIEASKEEIEKLQNLAKTFGRAKQRGRS